MRLFLITIISLLLNSNIFAQGCCSGGAGSPIAGGAATGVLQENQMEISLNYQFNQSNKFFNENKEATPLFGDLSSACKLSNKLVYQISSYFFKKISSFVSKFILMQDS